MPLRGHHGFPPLFLPEPDVKRQSSLVGRSEKLRSPLPADTTPKTYITDHRNVFFLTNNLTVGCSGRILPAKQTAAERRQPTYSLLTLLLIPNQPISKVHVRTYCQSPHTLHYGCMHSALSAFIESSLLKSWQCILFIVCGFFPGNCHLSVSCKCKYWDIIVDGLWLGCVCLWLCCVQDHALKCSLDLSVVSDD